MMRCRDDNGLIEIILSQGDLSLHSERLCEDKPIWP